VARQALAHYAEMRLPINRRSNFFDGRLPVPGRPKLKNVCYRSLTRHRNKKEFPLGAQVLALYNMPIDPTAFEQYYHGTHIPLAKRMPGLRSYVINKGPLASGDGSSAYYLVALLSFDSMDTLQAAIASPDGQAIVADLPNFATGGVTILTYETQVV
jgi:uncharacterized protein (TIGR02118 family)